MIGYKFISNSTSSDKLSYTAYLKPNIMDLMPNLVKYQKLDISITSNNSVTVKVSEVEKPSVPIQPQVLERKLNAPDMTFTIISILDEYTEKNYCFALRLPHNVSFQQDYFSTCDAKHQNESHFQLHHLNLGIFNFDLPNVREKYTSGLGERKGTFFLENGTTYALYNNDNRLASSYQAHGRKIVHGRNGFHSVIYGKHDTSFNNFAIVFANNEGREVQYWVRDKDPSFAVQSNSRDVSLNIYFDLENEALAQAVFKPFLDKQGKTAKIPPAWAFGHHMAVPETIN